MTSVGEKEKKTQKRVVDLFIRLGYTYLGDWEEAETIAILRSPTFASSWQDRDTEKISSAVPFLNFKRKPETRAAAFTM